MTVCGFSMELDSGALTRIADMPVRAACRHGGAVVASDGARLWRVGGTDDDGAPIAARVVLPATDCGDAAPKRLVGVALEGVVEGGMGVVAAGDSGACLEGAAGPAGAAGAPGRSVARLGRGHGRVWQATLAGLDGAAFELGAIALEILPLDRRGA